jgi:hypothetical protein
MPTRPSPKEIEIKRRIGNSSQRRGRSGAILLCEEIGISFAGEP